MSGSELEQLSYRIASAVAVQCTPGALCAGRDVTAATHVGIQARVWLSICQ